MKVLVKLRNTKQHKGKLLWRINMELTDYEAAMILLTIMNGGGKRFGPPAY